MEAAVITAVGIDVSKSKSTVAVRRPGGEIVLRPFEVHHTNSDLKKLASAFLHRCEFPQRERAGRAETHENFDRIARKCRKTKFRVLRVGGSIRVAKDSFDAWLNRAA